MDPRDWRRPTTSTSDWPVHQNLLTNASFYGSRNRHNTTPSTDVKDDPREEESEPVAANDGE